MAFAGDALTFNWPLGPRTIAFWIGSIVAAAVIDVSRNIYTSPESDDTSTSHNAVLAVGVLQMFSERRIAVDEAPTESTVKVSVVAIDFAATLKTSVM